MANTDEGEAEVARERQTVGTTSRDKGEETEVERER